MLGSPAEASRLLALPPDPAPVAPVEGHVSTIKRLRSRQ